MTISLPRVHAVILALAAAACSGTSTEPAVDTADLRALSAEDIAGSIALGETKIVEYSSTPQYRALQYHAQPGDTLDITVRARGAGVDIPVWLTRKDGEILAQGRTTLKHELGAIGGPVFIVFRHPALEAATFEVALDGKHLAAPTFTLPEWATNPAGIPVALRCTMNDIVFLVDMTMTVDAPAPISRRAPISFRTNNYDDEGLVEVRWGHKYLSDDSASIRGAKAPTTLFKHPDLWNAPSPGADYVRVRAESPAAITLAYENLYGDQHSKATIESVATGLRFTFSRIAPGEEPGYGLACTGEATAP